MPGPTLFYELSLCFLVCPIPAPPSTPAVRAKLKKAGRLQQALFNAAFSYKLFLLRQGLPFR